MRSGTPENALNGGAWRADSQTKEIQLSQDLLELFIAYQIPSDLLTYDGNTAVCPAEKVQAVKGHVEAIHKMVRRMKKQDVADAKQHHAFAHPEAARAMVGSARAMVDEEEMEMSFRTKAVKKKSMAVPAMPMAMMQRRSSNADSTVSSASASAPPLPSTSSQQPKPMQHQQPQQPQPQPQPQQEVRRFHSIG